MEADNGDLHLFWRRDTSETHTRRAFPANRIIVRKRRGLPRYQVDFRYWGIVKGISRKTLKEVEDDIRLALDCAACYEYDNEVGWIFHIPGVKPVFSMKRRHKIVCRGLEKWSRKSAESVEMLFRKKLKKLLADGLPTIDSETLKSQKFIEGSCKRTWERKKRILDMKLRGDMIRL